MNRFLLAILAFSLVFASAQAEEIQMTPQLKAALSQDPPKLTQTAQTQSCLNNLNAIGLSLEMYYSDYETYPETLTKLTPMYLKTIPACPSGKPFRYQTTETGWELMSEGTLPGCPAGFPRADSEKGVQPDTETAYPVWNPFKN